MLGLLQDVDAPVEALERLLELLLLVPELAQLEVSQGQIDLALLLLDALVAFRLIPALPGEVQLRVVDLLLVF